MTKRNKFYQIGFFTLAIAFIALCLFVGITAVQKQMRLKVSFNATPSIYVEVKLAKITNGVTGTFEPIFNNSGTPTLGTGITLTGNKLTITENFTTANSIGASFKLQITNLMSENGLKASFSGTGAAADTEYVVMKEYSTSNTDDTAEVTVSGNSAESLFEITFEEYYFYSVNTSPASGHFTFSGANEVEQKTEYNATLKAEVGYDLSITVTRKDGTTTTLTQNTDYTWDSSTGALTIYASAVTGDITINCTTTLQTFDITFDANDGIFASNSSDTYTIEDVGYNSTYNLPTPPTRANYDFSGWQENGAGDIWDIGTKTCTGATTWVAVWEALPYIIKTYDGTNSAWSGYYCVEFGEYPVAVATPSSPTATGETYTYGTNTFTIYEDANGKYATINSGTDYYKFEPIRWIVIAASTDIAGQYGTGSSITKDVTGTKQLLLLSEFGLYREIFDDYDEGSLRNQFGGSDCDVRVSLNGSFAKMAGLYNYFEEGEGVSEDNEFIAKVQPGTTYCNYDVEGFDSTSSYNMFFLGSTNGSDSNVDTYHWDEYMDSGSEQMQCVPTAFAKTTGVYYKSDYDATYWWLRSGPCNDPSHAYCVGRDGAVGGSCNVNSSVVSVRPSFILNLA